VCYGVTLLLSIGGYPKWSTFCCVVGNRESQGRDEFLKYHTAAIEIPSPTIHRIEEVSKATGVFVVMGVIERDGGTLYCTAIFVDPIEGLVAKHRKLVPTASERLIWGQGDGSTLPVVGKKFDSCIKEGHAVHTKISATICW
jgi:beta-cyano-L-alanine hydratase/nitrilase